MTPNQPYLLRAIHQWIIDNDMTPYILVTADFPAIEIPMKSVKDGQIVLNIAPHAITNMLMENEALSFSARFNGVAELLNIPMGAIKAIYASENGEGMFFQDIETTSSDEPKTSAPLDKTPPFLKVVK